MSAYLVCWFVLPAGWFAGLFLNNRACHTPEVKLDRSKDIPDALRTRPHLTKRLLSAPIMLRKLVNLAFHAWFANWLLVALPLTWTGCHLISAIGLPIMTAQALCCRLCHYTFHWFMIKSCPWVRVTPPAPEDVTRLLDRGRVCVLMNHTSFFDSVLFVAVTPPSVIWRYRTLMKNTLFNLPFLGTICRLVGHFPVFFRSNDENSFGVDKDEQAKIMIKVKEHVQAEGCLCLYPEGKINPSPAVLCPFRRGTFAIAEEMNMAVVTLTTVGNDETWPKGASVGGLPARVMMKLTEIAEAGHGMKAADIKEKAEASMQADVTFLMQKRDASNTKIF